MMNQIERKKLDPCFATFISSKTNKQKAKKEKKTEVKSIEVLEENKQ